MNQEFSKIDLVVLAGGKGSRLKNISKDYPKSLVKIKNINFMQLLLNKYCKYNFNKIYILVGYKKKYITNKFNNKIINFIKIKCLGGKKLLGTGGSLSALPKKNDFILINSDTYFDIDVKNFIKINKNYLAKIALVKNTNYKSNNKLSNLELENNNVIFSKNKKKYMNAGIYFFRKEIFNYIKTSKTSLENDLLPKLILKKKVTGHKYNNFFLDIGIIKNYNTAKKKIPQYLRRPAAFLDRDGVINEDTGYINNFENIKFREGVIKGLKYLIKNKYYIFIITNQAGIAKNKISMKQFNTLNIKLKKFLAEKNIYIDRTEYCPFHHKAINFKFRKRSNFRKPGNLMIKKITKEWFINIKKSFMIGDKISDKICAKKSGLYFEFANNNFYCQIKNIVKKD